MTSELRRCMLRKVPSERRVIQPAAEIEIDRRNNHDNRPYSQGQAPAWEAASMVEREVEARTARARYRRQCGVEASKTRHQREHRGQNGNSDQQRSGKLVCRIRRRLSNTPAPAAIAAPGNTNNGPRSAVAAATSMASASVAFICRGDRKMQLSATFVHQRKFLAKHAGAGEASPQVGS